MEPIPSYTRYQRQLLLPEWGPAAQRRLGDARILVIGAGGLGCPVLQYLAAAGAGTLGIADGDRVAATDLHRQIFYSDNDVDALKVEKAAAAVQRLNPRTQVVVYPYNLAADNIRAIVIQYDIVIDATDNFGARYLINDACVSLSKPLVYGSVFRFEGQVTVFNAARAGGVPGRDPRSPNLRDLFPHPPGPSEVPSCEEAGVLGVLPGIIGALQACEALKLATGVGTPLAGMLLTYDALRGRTYQVTYSSPAHA